jgi:hypothetical protein
VQSTVSTLTVRRPPSDHQLPADSTRQPCDSSDAYARHRKARQLLPTHVVHSGRSCCHAAKNEAVSRTQHMASPTGGAHASQRRRHRIGQQVGPHGLGCTDKERTVPASDSPRCWAADWTADDAWLKPSLEIASAIPTSAIQRLRSLCLLPGLLANYEMTNGQTRRFLNLLWEKVFKD